MAARFVLQQDGPGVFFYIFKTHSGQVLLTSPSYPDKDSALRRISSARSLAHNPKNYELRTARNEQSYFVVKNSKDEVLGQSEMYADSESARQGIDFMRSHARGARLEDLTGIS